MNHIASFDVFDTLLTRKVASPTSMFYIVGQRAACAGLSQLNAATFHDHRVRAENEARLSAPGKEVTFDEQSIDFVERDFLSRRG